MEQTGPDTKRTSVRFWMLSLVFVNVMINYLDRTNLSVAGPAVGKELNLSSVEMGLIFSAFGWSYALLQVPGGLLADRIGPRLLYAICLVTWSLATVFQGFVRDFYSLRPEDKAGGLRSGWPDCQEE